MSNFRLLVLPPLLIDFAGDSSSCCDREKQNQLLVPRLKSWLWTGVWQYVVQTRAQHYHLILKKIPHSNWCSPQHSFPKVPVPSFYSNTLNHFTVMTQLAFSLFFQDFFDSHNFVRFFVLTSKIYSITLILILLQYYHMCRLYVSTH